ncbi:heme peroxidase [Mycena olivaceomarginata]|nr:heme peroxidase [Mycena olivaceomarginata]
MNTADAVDDDQPSNEHAAKRSQALSNPGGLQRPASPKITARRWDLICKWMRRAYYPPQIIIILSQAPQLESRARHAYHAYVWPSPKLDALESLRFNQDGHNSGAITVFIEPCGRYLFDGPNVLTSKTGRSDVADWVRTAYHDMATHSVTDGTGGLDASIRFAEESLRAEIGAPHWFLRLNIGDGFNNTFQHFKLPLADMSALAFARQGFTQTEMISLVACGHTFGGVQHAAFPDTVPEINDPNNTQSAAHFDSTFTHFDNNLAIEYMSDTTQNPLVVGLNDTTNSDKRIFGSDGNVTMK